MPPYLSIPRPADSKQASPTRSKILTPRPDAVPRSEIAVDAAIQEVEGSMRRFRGHAKIEVTEMAVSADEIDYNEDTGAIEARGHVHYQNFVSGRRN